MGVVFKARDPLIGRLIALKTITTFAAEDPAMVERFWREAKAAGALQHANIVTIHDVGEADGVPFIAMEYLEGESLAGLISRGAPLSLTEKVGYLVQTCRALQYAHRRSVIHRDIKPANIVLTVEGVIKVVDFGIARVSDAPNTHTGTLLGTLGYMSPQQIRGKRADGLSDIWSVGVVLYELLTGRRPFKGGNQADLMRSIVQDEPAALSDVLGGCPYQLVTISRRALAKNEANRYQSMEQLLLDLKSAWASMHLNTSGEPAPAAGVQSAERAFAMQEAIGGRPLISQSAQRLEPRNLPARDARPSGLVGAPKAADVPVIPTPEFVPPPAPAIPSASASSASRAWPMPEWAGGSWQRGIAIFAAAFTIVTIGLEASRLRLHSSGSTPVSAASDAVTPASKPAPAVSGQSVSSQSVSSKTGYDRERAFRRREIDTRGAIRSRRGRVQSSRSGQGCRRIEIACLAGISAHRAGSRSPSQGRGGIRLLGDPQGAAQRYALAGDRMRRRCAQSGKRPGKRRSGRPLRCVRGARSAQSAVGAVLLAGVSSRRPARRVWATAWLCSL